VILYDDLIDKENNKKNAQFDEVIDTKAAFRHPNREKWRQGFDYMLQIASLSLSEQAESVEILIHQAQYNVGKAYFQGFGVKQSDAQTEKWWLLASDDGSAKGCVNAMTALAFFYSRKNDPEYFDLSKAYFWHNEGIVLKFIKSVTKSNIFVSYLACGNGSLESQGKFKMKNVFIFNIIDFKFQSARSTWYYVLFWIGM
jgi:TPR repeat protein